MPDDPSLPPHGPDRIGLPVFVTADNYGSPATVVAYRPDTPDTGSPQAHYQVRTNTGDVFWAWDFEIDWHPAPEAPHA